MLARKFEEVEFDDKIEFEEELDPKIKAELESALESIENGTAVFYTRAELEERLKATIAKYK